MDGHNKPGIARCVAEAFWEFRPEGEGRREEGRAAVSTAHRRSPSADSRTRPDLGLTGAEGMMEISSIGRPKVLAGTGWGCRLGPPHAEGERAG